MRHTLHSHIVYLENRIHFLKNRLRIAGLTREETEDLQRQLSSAELAVAHYRTAYALEIGASGSEPPTGSGDESDSGSGNGGDPNPPDKRKHGLVAVLIPMRGSLRGTIRRRPGRGMAGARAL